MNPILKWVLMAAGVVCLIAAGLAGRNAIRTGRSFNTRERIRLAVFAVAGSILLVIGVTAQLSSR